MKYLTSRYLYVGFAVLFLFACSEKEPINGVSNKISISTTSVSSITSDSAMGGGIISDDGGDVITDRGVCWSTNKAPTVNDTKASSGIGKGSFSTRIRVLLPNTTYYVRAYSVSNQGEVFGNEVSFKTAVRISTTATTNVTNITGSTATTGGQVVSDGGGAITDRGVCWSSLNLQPTINDNRFSLGSGSNTFPINLSNLMANTNYWVRAYSVNNAGIGYGAVVAFRTGAPTIAELSAVSINSIGRNAAVASASVNSNGGALLNAHGVCISTSASMNPRVCYWNSGNIIGPFTINLTNLLPGTVYYARAYATSIAGEGVSASISSFTTLAPVPPTVSATGFSNILFTSASMSGNVTDDGGLPILERGFFISLSTPTLSSTRVIASSTGTGSYSANISGLTSGTTYFYRAYARNAVNTSLSANTLSFTTQQANTPVVSTTQESNVMANSMVTGGNVTNDGGVPIVSRGLLWSRNPGVNINNATTVSSGSGIGIFSTTLSGLSANTIIYFRAFAQNSAGLVGYGSERSVITPLLAPVLSSPLNNANLGCCNWNFSWQAVSGATSYQIQISRNSAFSSSTTNISQCGSGLRPSISFVNVYTTNTASACLNAALSSGRGIWYWRVRAISGGNFSDWSTVRSFNYQ